MEGENPAFKKHSVGKVIDLKETFDRTDIWRIKNPETKQCTFRGKHVLGFLQRHLYYFLTISNMQEYREKYYLLFLVTTQLFSFSKD